MKKRATEKRPETGESVKGNRAEKKRKWPNAPGRNGAKGCTLSPIGKNVHKGNRTEVRGARGVISLRGQRDSSPYPGGGGLGSKRHWGGQGGGGSPYRRSGDREAAETCPPGSAQMSFRSKAASYKGKGGSGGEHKKENYLHRRARGGGISIVSVKRCCVSTWRLGAGRREETGRTEVADY